MKMYFGLQQTKDYTEELLRQLSPESDVFDSVDIFMIPDFISLPLVSSLIKNTKIMLGAQDCHYEDNGAFTGEVSPVSLAEVGCKIVELGHAERRRLFGETDEITGKKAAAAARNGLIPLVCIGEKTRGSVEVAVQECRVQVEAVLKAVPEDSEVILAYEPVWAIGQAEPAAADHVVGVTKELRQIVQGRNGKTRILYGGSAGPGLFEKLAAGVDGLFLGRFAHNVKSFETTIQEIAKAKEQDS